MGDKIIDAVSFHCGKCQSANLGQAGAVRTASDRIYLVFTCLDCGEKVPIELDKVLAELLKKTIIKGNGSIN